MRKIELFCSFLLLLGTVGIYAENNQVNKITEDKERCSSFVYPWDSGDGVRVQVGTDICQEEKDYLVSRKLFIENSINKLISLGDGESVKKIPKIAICLSGGGYRAMIGSLGFLLGAESIGLLGATSYVSALSGSSWLLGNLFTRMKKSNATLQEFHKLLRNRITKTKFLDASSMQVGDIVKKISSVLLERYRIEPIDLWGIILTDRLFGDLADAQNITFDGMRSCLSCGGCTQPFPLFSLVVSDVYPYEWFEVSPFVSGSDYLQAYVPTHAFDSIFKKGKRAKVLDQRSLGWFLGLLGSSYNASIGDVIVEIAKKSEKEWLVNLMKMLVDEYNLHEERFLSSPVFNPTWKMDEHPLHDRKQIEISDAGMSFNLPLPSLLKKERGVDIILVCEASRNAQTPVGPELHRAREYVLRRGLKFPSLDTYEKVSDNVLIFENKNDSTVPTVIYFVNSVSESTLKFDYDETEFDALCDTMRDEVVASKQAVVDAIRRKATLA